MGLKREEKRDYIGKKNSGGDKWVGGFCVSLGEGCICGGDNSVCVPISMIYISLIQCIIN